MSVDNPTVPRRRLGAELRRLRELTGRSVDEAAAALECSQSKISRLENGKGVPRSRDVRDLIKLYGDPAEVQRTRLLEWAAAGQARGWWNSFRDVIQGEHMPDHLLRLISLESGASRITAFEPEVIPGLLQTEEYVSEVSRLVDPALLENERRRFVDFRIERQEVVHRKGSDVALQFVVGELALVRPLVGAQTHARQLQVLHDRLGDALRHVDLRILPLSASVREAVGGSFLILNFAEEHDQDVVYLEGRDGATYLEKSDDVKRFDEAFKVIYESSMSRNDSLARLSELSAGAHVL